MNGYCMRCFPSSYRRRSCNLRRRRHNGYRHGYGFGCRRHRLCYRRHNSPSHRGCRYSLHGNLAGLRAGRHRNSYSQHVRRLGVGTKWCVFARRHRSWLNNRSSRRPAMNSYNLHGWCRLGCLSGESLCKNCRPQCRRCYGGIERRGFGCRYRSRLNSRSMHRYTSGNSCPGHRAGKPRLNKSRQLSSRSSLSRRHSIAM